MRCRWDIEGEGAGEKMELKWEKEWSVVRSVVYGAQDLFQRPLFLKNDSDI